MPTKKQLPQMEDESVRILLREPCTLWEKKLGLIVSSLHHVLTCALFDTRMFSCAREAAKRPYKKINNCAVDADVKGVKKVFQHRFLFK